MKRYFIFKTIILLFHFIQFTSCTNAQQTKEEQIIAICSEGKGCEFSELNISATEVDKLLGKINFLSAAPSKATLIMDNCDSKIDDKSSLEEIDISYGGKGSTIVFKQIDLEKYLKENSCILCPNETKKISFYVNGEGQSGNSFFYLNLKSGEAFMPNEAFQLLNTGENDEMVIDQFIRNNSIEMYAIAEGNKYVTKMPLGSSFSTNHTLDEQHFKKDFKKTGKTRKHLNTTIEENEYTGVDNEGNNIHFWIAPIYNVCLPQGKFDTYGFFNLGYISIDGMTYLVTEISGAGFHVKVTDISDGSYHFNTEGYKSFNTK